MDNFLKDAFLSYAENRGETEITRSLNEAVEAFQTVLKKIEDVDLRYEIESIVGSIEFRAGLCGFADGLCGGADITLTTVSAAMRASA